MLEILPQLLVNALIAGSIYALISVGLSMTYGLLGVLNFAHGHLMMVGGFLFYLATVTLEMNLAAATAFTCIGMIACAMIAFSIFVVPFTRYSLILTLVTTLALSNILEAVISMAFGVNVKSLTAGASGESLQLGSVYITPLQIGIIAVAIVLLGILGFVVHRTPLGRKIRALSEYSSAAEALGISKLKVSYLVFTVSVLMAVVAGVLLGYEATLQPTMGGSYTTKAFAAMILGGLGNIWGTVAGAYILGTIENLGIGLDFGGYSIPAGYKDAFAFFIILLLLLVRPQGLFGKAKRRA